MNPRIVRARTNLAKNPKRNPKNVRKRRQKPLVSSFVRIASGVKRTRAEARINQERAIVLRQLLKQGRSVILSVSKNLAPQEKKLIDALKKVKGGKLRVVTFGQNSVYNASWMRDVYSPFKRRVLNKVKVQDKAYKTKKESRYFGDGGRVIDCGKINGKPTILVSSSYPTQNIDSRKLREIREEIEMLKRRGYTVHELPGDFYQARGHKQGNAASREFFAHLDVFINHIKGTNILLTDNSYYTKNKARFERMKGFKVVLIPEKEKYFYPANFLNVGNKEIIMDKNAKQTMELLRKNGVTVYSTPVSLHANRENLGGIRCFVNEG